MEKILIKKVKKGDRSAFNDLFAKYSPRLFHFSMHYLHNQADAEEIVQETFLQVWETRDRINENLSFSNYLIFIARRRIYNHFRRKAVEMKYNLKLLEEMGERHSSDQESSLGDVRTMLISAIDKLPTVQQQVIRMRGEGYSNQEIADKLNISKRTVETHIGRSFKSLRTQLAGKTDIMLFTILPFHIFGV